MGRPDKVWNALFQKFQYASSLPTRNHALDFLNMSEARITYLATQRDNPEMSSTVLAARVYIENVMLKGAFMGSTFFIPAEIPITDRRVHLQNPSQAAISAVGIIETIDPVRRN